VTEVKGLPLSLFEGTVEALPSRKINETTCQHWGYRVGKYDEDTSCQAAHFLTRIPGNSSPSSCALPTSRSSG
jgi:hypothetical protein